jgi:Type I phosphodiesterase / nucleotide pyrophosphatase
MIRHIFGFLLLIALTLAPAIARQVRDDLWASYRTYASPYLAELPAGTGRPALSPRVVCVLVRGLRLEESRNLPTLQTLRQKGLDATVALAPPTYRVPSWIGFASGATPEVHGMTRNDVGLPQVDTIFKQLRAANKNAAVIGTIQWSDWFGPDLARFEETIEPEINARDDAAINTAIQVLQDVQQPAQFVLIELAALDGLADAGARTRTITTSQAISITPTPNPLELLDARLFRLISTLDLATNTVMVLSDRGRDADGNDGGDDADVSRVRASNPARKTL